MSNTSFLPSDKHYLEIFVRAIRNCLEYRPKFGKSGEAGLDLATFQELYAQDPFYQWLGLDSPLVYTAHKAAGGITSIYRQIGIACQEMFRQIVQDQLALSSEQTAWQYAIPAAGNKQRTLALDARIELADIKDEQKVKNIRQWLDEAGNVVRLTTSAVARLRGAIFEVRQEYKSKDSKRQNADLANAARAYADGYLPVIILFSQQIDNDIARRYRENAWRLLVGQREGLATTSTYVFCRDIIGYDMAAFFDRHAHAIRAEIEAVLSKLLSPE